MDLHAKARPNRCMIASCGEDASWDVTRMHDKQGSRMHDKQGSVHDSSACGAEMHDKQGSVNDSSSCCDMTRVPLFHHPKHCPACLVCRPQSAGAAQSRLYGLFARTPHTVAGLWRSPATASSAWSSPSPADFGLVFAPADFGLVFCNFCSSLLRTSAWSSPLLGPRMDLLWLARGYALPQPLTMCQPSASQPPSSR